MIFQTLLRRGSSLWITHEHQPYDGQCPRQTLGPNNEFVAPPQVVMLVMAPPLRQLRGNFKVNDTERPDVDGVCVTRRPASVQFGCLVQWATAIRSKARIV